MSKNMKKWDGRDKHGNYQYPLKEIDAWNMQIDENGNVWYFDKSQDKKLSLWCSSERLTKHLRHLERIKAR